MFQRTLIVAALLFCSAFAMAGETEPKAAASAPENVVLGKNDYMPKKDELMKYIASRKVTPPQEEDIFADNAKFHAWHPEDSPPPDSAAKSIYKTLIEDEEKHMKDLKAEMKKSADPTMAAVVSNNTKVEEFGQGPLSLPDDFDANTHPVPLPPRKVHPHRPPGVSGGLGPRHHPKAEAPGKTPIQVAQHDAKHDASGAKSENTGIESAAAAEPTIATSNLETDLEVETNAYAQTQRLGRYNVRKKCWRYVGRSARTNQWMEWFECGYDPAFEISPKHDGLLLFMDQRLTTMDCEYKYIKGSEDVQSTSPPYECSPQFLCDGKCENC